MFSDPNLDYTFNLFLLHTWLVFLILSYVAILHFLRKREAVVIYYKVILERIK